MRASGLLRLAVLAAAYWPVLALAADPSLEKVLTLRGAQKLSLDNNASVLSAAQDIVIAQQRAQEAWFQFFPEVGLQASATRYDARYPFALAPEFRSILLFPSSLDRIYSGRTYLTHTLYAGGRNHKLLRLAQTALKQAQTRYEAMKMETLLGVQRGFYQLILSQDRVREAGERLATARRLAEQSLPGWERVEAEGVVAELRMREAQAGHARELALLDFRKQLNLELDTPLRVEGDMDVRPADIDLSRAVVWAMELRPELQAETYKAQADDIAVSLAQGRRIPTVALSANYEVTGQRFPLRQNNWDATLGLRVPLSYDFWTQIVQKRAEKRQGEIQRAELQDRVRLEVRQAYEQLEFWSREWPLREREHVRLKTLAEASNQRGGLPALRAQPVLLGAYERYRDSLKEYSLSRAGLERAIGRPLAP